MFREMRRRKQLLPEEKSVSILERMTSGVLAVMGDNGYPYAVPLSYVYCDGKLYFHSAKTGHKIEAIIRNEKVSFCVIEQDNVVPEEYTTYFRSVIVFGKARILTDDKEKRKAMEILAEKYSPSQQEGRLQEIEKSFKHFVMIELLVESMTGKEAIGLVRKVEQGNK
ncbi:MAG TPA: pyridoxamine 5'-phosphate oxidase family protein [Candidatus Avirikenella pullistercoris]|nr:pyridoxamine 5'-phosphate oxidase family protein [Candidatus Avirikenella pullistercoris]